MLTPLSDADPLHWLAGLQMIRVAAALIVVLALAIGSARALPSVFVDRKEVSRTRAYENVLPPQLYERMASDAKAMAAYETGYTLKDNKKRTRYAGSGREQCRGQGEARQQRESKQGNGVAVLEAEA